MSFSCADNERFNDALVVLAEGKYDALVAACVARHFDNEVARMFASRGFPRRLELMKQCLLGSMEPFPPRISWAPSRFEILDAVIHLQAFVVNARGCTDNLAHVWVREKELTGEDGARFADAEVGFEPGNEVVLGSLSPELAGYLRDLGPWFKYLGRLLHALEHHVPRTCRPRRRAPRRALRQSPRPQPSHLRLQGFFTEGRRNLLEIAEARHGPKFILITSQIPQCRPQSATKGPFPAAFLPPASPTLILQNGPDPDIVSCGPFGRSSLENSSGR